MSGPLEGSSCSPVGLVVRLIFDAFKTLGLQRVDDGSAKVGDGVCPVLQVETVTRGVQTVNGGQPVEMVLPRLVGIEGVDASSHASRYVVNWPVPIERARVVVSIDGAWGVSVDLAVDWQVAVAGDGDPLGGGDGIVVDRLGVGVGGQEFGEHAAACGPVPLLCSDVFRSF